MSVLTEGEYVPESSRALPGDNNQYESQHCSLDGLGVPHDMKIDGRALPEMARKHSARCKIVATTRRVTARQDRYR